MTDYIFYLFLGAGAGAIIAAFGLGLLIIHQGSGIVNFGYGAMATWAGYVYADLRSGAYPFPVPGLPARYHFGGDVGYRWALLLSLLTAATMASVVFVLVFRPLMQAPSLAKVVASIGVIIVFIALIGQRFGDDAVLRVDPILPRKPVTIMSGVTVPSDGLWLAFVVTVLGLVAWCISRFTKWGLAIRAAAENEKGAMLLGYSPTMLAGTSFVVASLIGALAVILAAPLIQLSAIVFTFGFMIPALGAALAGRFNRIVITIATGLGIGAAQSIFTKLQVDFGWFPKYGAREGLPFIAIVVVMMLLGDRIPGRGAVKEWKLPAVPPARMSVLTVLPPVVIAAVGLLVLGPLWRGAIMTTITAVVMSLSLVVLTGFAGQTSLAQVAFAGVGGFALSRLATQWGVPFPLAPLLAASIAAGVGVLVGFPALRVRGTNLAIVTLAGGIAISEFIFKNPKYVGDQASGGAKVPNPRLGRWDLGLVLGDQVSRPVFGFCVLLVAVLCAGAVGNLRRSATGRRILAVRSNERAASSIGVSVAAAKLQAFAVSSFIAGLAGCLIAYRFGSVSDASFTTIASLTALAVAYLGGITCISGAVTAGIMATSGVAFYAMSNGMGRLGDWEIMIGGVLLIITAVANPEGIAGGIRIRFAHRRRAS